MGEDSIFQRLKTLTKWHRIKKYQSSKLTAFAAAYPVFGYLILFNKPVRDLVLQIPEGASCVQLSFLSTDTILHTLYFGLLILSIAQLIFQFRCPPEVRDNLSFSHYIQDVFQAHPGASQLGILTRAKIAITQELERASRRGEAFHVERAQELRHIAKIHISSALSGDEQKQAIRLWFYCLQKKRRWSRYITAALLLIGYILLASVAINGIARVVSESLSRTFC